MTFIGLSPLADDGKDELQAVKIQAADDISAISVEAKNSQVLICLEPSDCVKRLPMLGRRPQFRVAPAEKSLMRKSVRVTAVTICIAISVCVVAKPAAAISLDLAKKCRTMALQAHPYKLPGEKGPGSATAEREYFTQCVAKGGNMTEQNSATGQKGESGQSNVKPGQSPAPTK
jgi:hypothetical protein